MNYIKKILITTYIIFFINLLISNYLLFIVSSFYLVNLLLFFFVKLSQKDINKLSALQISGWVINSYIVFSNNNNLWFLILTNLLWLLSSIKILEVKNNINLKNIIIFFFLSIGTFSLFSLSTISNTINIICIISLIYSLLLINNYKKGNFLDQLVLLISLLPFTFLSLIYIPKSNPWLKINSGTIAKTGINNQLKPGDISSLAQSEELIGRVFFNSELPIPEERYWRLIVLDVFENNTWTSKQNFDEKNIFLYKSKKQHINNLKDLNSEKWILEPNFINQRPWSGKGQAFNEELFITKKGTLISKTSLRERQEYQLFPSRNDWRKISAIYEYPKIDQIKNKSLFELARKWADESNDSQEILNKAKDWFKNGDYIYSLNPGSMRKDKPYDDFLFNKKIGFCEHFAGSFALLMRYANIPSRIVVGYQGGEVYKSQENKNYILIDNKYAHAWNEVYIEKKGWIRIDPTSWVAPERIMNTSILLKENNSKIPKFATILSKNFGRNLKQLELNLEDFIYKIKSNFKIFNFSKSKIVNRLLAIVSLLITILLTTFFILIFDFTNHRDLFRNILDIYLYFLKLKKIKLRSGESLKSFSSRVCKLYPEKQFQINEITNLYNSTKFECRYISRKNKFLLIYKLFKLILEVLFFINIKNIRISNRIFS